MREIGKVLMLEGGEQFLISPLSYEQFVALDLWNGSSDAAYDLWLHRNRFADLTRYRENEVRRGVICTCVVERPEVVFNPSGDGVTWIASKAR